MAVAFMTETDSTGVPPAPPSVAGAATGGPDAADAARPGIGGAGPAGAWSPGGGEVDGAGRDATGSEPTFVGSLSPSRAADFKNCPLLYRFRTIDRLPEQPSSAATRGTVVHAVLEQLYDLPAPERTLAAAQELVAPVWAHLLAEEPGLAALFADRTYTDQPVADQTSAEPPATASAGLNPAGAGIPAEPPSSPQLEQWLDSARDLVANYFTLEDPRRLEPAAREERVEVVIDGLRLRGYVDRLDVSPAGDIRVVDYKTGSTPREAFEGKALFQMKFYALVLWRTRGVVPRQLRLIYLADVDTLTYSPEAEELERFERTLHAIWAAIQKATEAQDFRPNPGRLCDWCDHHASCPAQGGVLPPFPVEALASAGHDRRTTAAVGTTTDELPLVAT